MNSKYPSALVSMRARFLRERSESYVSTLGILQLERSTRPFNRLSEEDFISAVNSGYFRHAGRQKVDDMLKLGILAEDARQSVKAIVEHFRRLGKTVNQSIRYIKLMPVYGKGSEDFADKKLISTLVRHEYARLEALEKQTPEVKCG